MKSNNNNVVRMVWVLRWSDSKGDIWIEPFKREADAIFCKAVRGGKISRGFIKEDANN